MAMSKTVLLAALASISAASPVWSVLANSTTSCTEYPGGGGIPSSSVTSPSASTTASESPTPSGGPPSTGLGDTYNFYQGDGSLAQGWPDQDKWVDFDTMWTANMPGISESCTNLQVHQADPSEEEIADLHEAILSISGESDVDPRFILAVVMQESKGCVRVWQTTSPDDIPNPGLMQDHSGNGSCNTGTQSTSGHVQDPCPADEITQMIKDGTEGTDAGDGLVQVLQEAGTSDASQYYIGARIYNSGSVDPSGDLGQTTATRCYSSDIAYRLTGWVYAARDCTLDGPE